MQFMLMLKADRDYEAGIPPDPRLLAAMNQFISEAARSGALIASDALKPSSAGTRVRLANGRLLVTEGPFAATRELVAGYAVLRFGSRLEAVEAAKRLLKLHEAILGQSFEGECEIRPIAERPDTAPTPDIEARIPALADR